MAQELQISTSASFTGATGSDSITTVSKKVDSTDVAVLRNQPASSSPTTLTFPAASGRIAAVISNTGATNNLLVDLVASGGTYPISIPPGACMAVFLASGSGDVFVKAAASTTTYDVLTA